MYNMDHTNVGLVAHVRKYAGVANYWFGTYGQIATNTLWASKAKQYPSHYSDKRKAFMKERGDIGKPVCDCAGLIKWYLMMNKEGFPPDYTSKYDISADGFYNHAIEKGTIDTIPEIIGLAVWRKGHIGVYIGNGKVVEAKGFDYGVVISRLEKTTFTHWLKIPYIAYANVGATIPPTKDDDDTQTTTPTGGEKKVNVTLTQLSKGSKGAEVKTLQILLNEKGTYMHLMTDGDFGSYTKGAVMDWQAKHKSVCGEVDGIVGKKTWTSILTA